MVTVSLDSPSCEVTLFNPVSVVYRDATQQAKGLYRLKYVGALRSGFAYLSRYNSGWFYHTSLEFDRHRSSFLCSPAKDPIATIQNFLRAYL
jgi:hypothetical protein